MSMSPERDSGQAKKKRIQLKIQKVPGQISEIWIICAVFPNTFSTRDIRGKKHQNTICCCNLSKSQI